MKRPRPLLWWGRWSWRSGAGGQGHGGWYQDMQVIHGVGGFRFVAGDLSEGALTLGPRPRARAHLHTKSGTVWLV